MSTFVPLTSFYLLKDVDIDVSYNNQYYFHEWKVPTDQYNFFYAKRFKEVQGGTYQRKNRGTISLPFQADEIRECKYIMWQNLNYSDKWYYAFVTSIDYVNPSVSLINYQLDVFQTYYFEIKNSWGTSFIERMHTDRWNTDLTPVVNTIPENLEIGDSYRTLERKNLYQIGDVSFIVIGMTKSISGATNQLISNVPAVLKYYVVPISLNKTNYHFRAVDVHGQSITPSGFLGDAQTVLDFLFHNESFVNTVVSVYLMPFLPVNNSDLVYTIETQPTYYVDMYHPNFVVETFSTSTIDTADILTFDSTYIPKPWEMTSLNKYDKFPIYEESKLLMHPYSYTEMSSDRGSVFIIKNEYVNGNNIQIGCFATLTSMSKMSFLVKNYLNGGNINNVKMKVDPHVTGGPVETYTKGYLYEQGINESGNNEMPIIDDYTASYMQSHRNSLNVSQSNALLQYNQDLRNAETNRKISSTEINRDFNKGIVSTGNEVVQGLTSLVNGLISSENGTIGKIRGATAGVSGLASAGASLANAYINKNASLAIQDMNYSMANDVAGTKYQKETASVLASIQDAQQIPPSVSTMGSEYVFDIAYWRDGIYLYPKTLLPEYAQKLTDYFKKYGYKVNVNVNPEEITYQSGNERYNHFDNRKYWNYIKIREPILNASIPMDDLMTIKGIFMEGITLWHGDYVGDYERANNEISDIYPHGANNTATIIYNPEQINGKTWYLADSTGTRIVSGVTSLLIGTPVNIVTTLTDSEISNIIVNGVPLPKNKRSFILKMNTLFELY